MRLAYRPYDSHNLCLFILLASPVTLPNGFWYTRQIGRLGMGGGGGGADTDDHVLGQALPSCGPNPARRRAFYSAI
jgi:hypothetical protein